MSDRIDIADENLPIGMVVARYKGENANLRAQLAAAQERMRQHTTLDGDTLAMLDRILTGRREDTKRIIELTECAERAEAEARRLRGALELIARGYSRHVQIAKEALAATPPSAPAERSIRYILAKYIETETNGEARETLVNLQADVLRVLDAPAEQSAPCTEVPASIFDVQGQRSYPAPPPGYRTNLEHALETLAGEELRELRAAESVQQPAPYAGETDASRISHELHAEWRERHAAE